MEEDPTDKFYLSFAWSCLFVIVSKSHSRKSVVVKSQYPYTPK